MLDEATLADTMHCPSCQRELPENASRCPHCGLVLTAPQLQRVWQKSRQIAELLETRARLLADVRAEDEHNARRAAAAEHVRRREDADQPSARESPEPLSGADVVVEQEAFADPDTAAAVEEELGPPEPGVDARPDLAPPSARTALLVLGGVLFTIAVVFFAAVAWGRPGAAAPTAALAVTTAVVAGCSALAVRRRLAATAEALAGLTVALLLVDAYALRRAGVGDSVEASTYWAIALTVVVVAVLPSARWLRIVPRLTVAVLAQLPVPLVADGFGSSSVLAFVLGVQALALVVVEARWGSAVAQASGRVGHALRIVAGGGAALAGAYAAALALVVATGLGSWFAGDDPRLTGSLVLATLSLVPWTAAYLHLSRPPVRHGGSATAVALLLVACTTAASALGLPGRWVAVVAAMLTAGAALLVGRMPRPVRPGPLVAVSLFAVGALAAVGLRLLTLLASPVLWWVTPWSAGMWSPARELLGPQLPIPMASPGAALPGAFPAVVTAGLVAVTLAFVARGMRTPRGRRPESHAEPRPQALIDLRYAGAGADIVGTAAAAAVPVALPVPHVLGVLLQLGVGGVLLLRPAPLTRQLSTSSRVAATLGGMVVALALSWSVAARGTTVVAGALAAVLLAAGAAYSPVRERSTFAGLSALVVCAEVGAVALALYAPLAVTAAAVAFAAGAIAILAGGLGRAARRGAEVGALLAYLLALLVVAEAGLGGLIALVGAVAAAVAAGRSDRRGAAAGSAALACLAAALFAVAAGTGWTGAAYALALTGCAVSLIGAYVLLPMGMTSAKRPRADQLTEPERDAQARDWAAKAVEIVGALGYVTALALRVPAWPLWELCVLFAIGGLTATAVALRPQRRPAWRLAYGLLTASWWAGLAAAGVELLEVYTVPSAAALVVGGALRRRRHPEMGSWRAYTSALVLMLGPSLYVALTGDDLMRPLLLGAAALAITVTGARRRLQAPLAIGGVVVSIDALFHAVPYAAGMPRWATIGAAGVALLALGATYDRRLRDLRRLQERIGKLN